MPHSFPARGSYDLLSRRAGGCLNAGRRPFRSARNDRGSDRTLSHPAWPDRPHGAGALPERPRLEAFGPQSPFPCPGWIVRLKSLAATCHVDRHQAMPRQPLRRHPSPAPTGKQGKARSPRGTGLFVRAACARERKCRQAARTALRSLDLGFLELDMLAHDGIIFPEAQLLGLGARILLGDVEEAGVSRADEANLDGCWLGHGLSPWS